MGNRLSLRLFLRGAGSRPMCLIHGHYGYEQRNIKGKRRGREGVRVRKSLKHTLK